MRVVRLATALAIVLASGEFSRAQGLDETFLNAMVQIVGTRNGETVRGSGFVVAIDRERSIAIVATSAHVIEGTKFEAIFAADPSQSPRPTEIVGIEAENRNGLAAFRVRSVPSGTTALEVANWGEPGPRPAQALTLIGYPNTSVIPLARSRGFSGQEGALYLIDLGVGEGSSGGPVVLNGKVVGVVTATTDAQTYAVPFATLRTFLQGYRVSLSAATPPPAAAPPAADPPAVPPPAASAEPAAGKPAAPTTPAADPVKPPAATPSPAEPDKSAASKPAGTLSSPFSAMVTLTGTVKGATVKASGFVVALRRSDNEVYVLTTARLFGADDLRIVFAVDRDHPLPARTLTLSYMDVGDKSDKGQGVTLVRVDSAGPEAATALAILDTFPATPRAVQLVAATDGNAHELLERRYLGPDRRASFLLTLDGAVDAELLGGPVLFDGKVGGVLIIGTAGTVAYGGDPIRQLLAGMKLIEQPVKLGQE